MATGASNADLAVLLVDARKGLLSQTCRHAIIAVCSAFVIVVLAVNKMDLIDFDQAVFDAISSNFVRLRCGSRLPGYQAHSDFGAIWRQRVIA